MTDSEFGSMASWTADAIERLGGDHAVPGACRGSGGPAALTWLATWLVDREPMPFLDLGGGLGGPSAWLSGHHDIAPVMAEPEADAVAGARRLFGLRVAQAEGSALPFPDHRFAAGWCLGVLSTAPNREALLSELARVVRPDGRIGLVVYVSTEARAITEPKGNHFPTWSELDRDLTAAGLQTVATVSLNDLPEAESSWDRRADAVDHEVARVHGVEPTWLLARADEDRVADLLQCGRVRGHALRLTT